MLKTRMQITILAMFIQMLMKRSDHVNTSYIIVIFSSHHIIIIRQAYNITRGKVFKAVSLLGGVSVGSVLAHKLVF